MGKNELVGKVDDLKEILGTEQLLNELVSAMSSDELQANLEHIDRMHDTNIM